MNCPKCQAPISESEGMCQDCQNTTLKETQHFIDVRTFINSAIEGDVEKVKQYITHGINLNEVTNNFGTTVFLEVVMNRVSEQIIELLLSHGANPRIADKNGTTPLHSAKTVNTAKLLIENGADILACDDAGWQPIHFAADNPLLLDFLINNGADPSATNFHGMSVVSQAKNKRSIAILGQYVDVGQSTGCLVILLAIILIIVCLIIQ